MFLKALLIIKHSDMFRRRPLHFKTCEIKLLPQASFIDDYHRKNRLLLKSVKARTLRFVFSCIENKTGADNNCAQRYKHLHICPFSEIAAFTSVVLLISCTLLHLNC